VPVRVLQQLGHLRLRQPVDGDHALHHPAVETDGAVPAVGGEPADHLGCVAEAVRRVARVDPLRRVGQVEILPGDQSRLLENRSQDLLGGSRPGGGLEHHQGAGAQVAGDRAAGSGHRAQVGPVVVVQRRGHADDGHRAAAEHRLVRGGGEPLAEHGRDVLIGEIVDVGSTGVELIDQALHQIQADHAQPRRGRRLGER
jgi:hypothetical protein